MSVVAMPPYGFYSTASQFAIPLDAAAFSDVALASRKSSIFLRRNSRLNVFAGELEGRPPGAPTTNPSVRSGRASDSASVV
jgi:hypothetical protein